jgi:hypothetical protein
VQHVGEQPCAGRGRLLCTAIRSWGLVGLKESARRWMMALPPTLLHVLPPLCRYHLRGVITTKETGLVLMLWSGLSSTIPWSSPCHQQPPGFPPSQHDRGEMANLRGVPLASPTILSKAGLGQDQTAECRFISALDPHIASLVVWVFVDDHCRHQLPGSQGSAGGCDAA